MPTRARNSNMPSSSSGDNRILPRRHRDVRDSTVRPRDQQQEEEEEESRKLSMRTCAHERPSTDDSLLLRGRGRRRAAAAKEEEAERTTSASSCKSLSSQGVNSYSHAGRAFFFFDASTQLPSLRNYSLQAIRLFLVKRPATPAPDPDAEDVEQPRDEAQGSGEAGEEGQSPLAGLKSRGRISAFAGGDGK